MACKTDNFKFDPDKTALENLFALIFRTNRIKLDPNFVDVELPRALEPGEDNDGDNTVIKIVSKPGGPYKGSSDLFYARADINTHYPTFTLDGNELKDIYDKEALIAFLDGRFNLVDGEFDIDINDPFESLTQFTDVDIFAKDTSLIYIGRKKIHIFWSGDIRRITEEGILRVTDEGYIRVVEPNTLD
ncbi:hypothetical protein D3C76_25390 [compost metagenome]